MEMLLGRVDFACHGHARERHDDVAAVAVGDEHAAIDLADERERGFAARNQARVLQEAAQAKKRCGLPESAPVVSCYEAGREDFG